MDKLYLEDCLNRGMSTRDISKDCGLHRNTISYWIKKYNLNSESKYAKLPKYLFGEIDTKEKAYVLGFLLADGGISEKCVVDLGCAISDKEVIIFIAKVVGANVRYDYSFDKKTRRFPRARISRKINDVIKFTGGRLKEERHYPRIRKDLEKYMLLGFFDSDGCITWGRRKDRNRVWQKICFNSQYKLLVGIQKYLSRNLNISTSIKPKSNHEKCYILEFSERSDVLKFCEHIYSDNNFIILKRKYLKYDALRLELEENGEGRKVS